jgi:hypothetical protein
MAIKFETVTGNQASANVLAQINNNFAKINSTPVPKADFATNADTVDSKHASDLIPGAATFLNSISTLANLSVGRYFCTQTRQSWEPVTTTGNRTFLIEVSLNTPNSLKSYKITYIAGAGAGESYYSDYNSGSIRWNRIINNNNVTSVDAIKNTYDENDISGRVTTYDNMIVYKEDKEMVVDDFISANDGTGNYYQISSSCSYSRSESSGRCSTTYYWNLYVTVKIYNSSFSLIQTVTSPAKEVQIYGTSDAYRGSGVVVGQVINQTTGDIIIAAFGKTDYSLNYYGNPDGYFYFSTATNSIIFIPYSGAIEIDPSYRNTMQIPTYWYNNYFGFLKRGSDRSSSSAYFNIQMYYIELNANRNSIVANSNATLISSAYNWNLIGQKGQYLYICTNTNSYTSQPSLVKVDITTRSTQSATIPIASTTSSSAYPTSSMMDEDFMYICIRYQTSSSNYYYKIVKYNESLTLAGTSPQFENDYTVYIVLTNNYIGAFSSSTDSSYPTRCFNKSNLNLVSSYNKSLYISGGHNPVNVFGYNYLIWWKQEFKNNNINAVYVNGDYVLVGTTTGFYNGGDSSSYEAYYPLYSIISISNGNILGYFANTLLYNQSNDTRPFYLDGIGLCFRKKLLNTNNVQYLLKSFKIN